MNLKFWKAKPVGVARIDAFSAKAQYRLRDAKPILKRRLELEIAALDVALESDSRSNDAARTVNHPGECGTRVSSPIPLQCKDRSDEGVYDLDGHVPILKAAANMRQSLKLFPVKSRDANNLMAYLSPSNERSSSFRFLVFQHVNEAKQALEVNNIGEYQLILLELRNLYEYLLHLVFALDK